MYINASHILVDTLDEANEIKELLDNGADFYELAQKYSKCSTRDTGGNLGFFNKGKMVKAFEDAAYALPVNHISEPVKTQFGYHLILRLY